jgi:RimJ/RimL family protein N-acetyltransferase
MADQFNIRPATKEDARLLFEWRNDESTRRMFKNKGCVQWDEHLNWLDRRLKMECPNLFLFEENGAPVATFRIDGGSLSYTAAPEHRNRGIATVMLKEVRSRFGRLRAEIYSDNLASITVAREAGLEVIIIDA